MKKNFKSMSKRTLAIAMALVMLLTAVPIVGFTAFAMTSGDFEYEMNGENSCIVTEYTGENMDIVIPESIDGYKVTGIDVDSLLPWEAISLTVPKTVENIKLVGSYGSYYYTLEKFIVDPENANYSSVDGVLFTKDKTTLLAYPDNKKDTEYSVPEGTVEVVDTAFGCTGNLETLNIPKSLQKIGFSSDKSSLLENLENIQVASDNAYYSCVDGVLFTKDKTELVMYPARLSNSIYEIPEGTVKANFACRCRFTGAILVPASVKALSVSEDYYDPYFLFKGSVNDWNNIEKSPNAVQVKTNWDGKGFFTYSLYDGAEPAFLDSYIGYEAEVTIPTEIDGYRVARFRYAFENSNVKKVTVPYSDYFSDYYGNSFIGVEEIAVDPAEPRYTTVDGVLFSKDKTTIWAYPSKKPGNTYTVPDGVTTLGLDAFNFSENLESLVIPKSVTLIDQWCFYGCKKLTDIYYGGTKSDWDKVIVEDLGNDSFNNITVHFTEEPEHTHSYTESITKEATCKEDGVKTFTCSCGDSYTEVIPKTEHKNIKEITVPSTCTVKGMRYSICSDCGEQIGKSTILPLAPHDYKSEVTKKATCTEAGVKTFTCSVCKNSYTEEIAATGHQNLKEVVVPATCKVQGMKYTICTDCGEQIGESAVLPVIPHDCREEVTKEATCTEAGVKSFICTMCKETITTEEIPATGHSFGEWVVIKEPTETEKGLKESTCANCGEKKTEEIPCLPQRVQDEQSGITIDAPSGSYDGKLEMSVEEQFDGESFQIINGMDGVSQSKVYDITTTVGGEKVQPGVPVTVRIPLPEGYNPEHTFVYHINSETGEVENMNARVENGYLVFETDHFSIYAVVEEEPEKDYGVIGNILKVVVDFVVKVVCVAFEFIKYLWNAIF